MEIEFGNWLTGQWPHSHKSNFQVKNTHVHNCYFSFPFLAMNGLMNRWNSSMERRPPLTKYKQCGRTGYSQREFRWKTIGKITFNSKPFNGAIDLCCRFKLDAFYPLVEQMRLLIASLDALKTLRLSGFWKRFIRRRKNFTEVFAIRMRPQAPRPTQARRECSVGKYSPKNFPEDKHLSGWRWWWAGQRSPTSIQCKKSKIISKVPIISFFSFTLSHGILLLLVGVGTRHGEKWNTKYVKS